MTKKIKYITLIRREGLIGETDKPVNVFNLRMADTVLQHWRSTAPDYNEGYHKVGFTIHYTDGSIYEGRYDLNKANYRSYADKPTLKEHIVAIKKLRPKLLKPTKTKVKKPAFGSVAWQNEQAKKIQAKIKSHKPLSSSDKAFASVQLQHNLGIGEKQAENIVKKTNVYLSRPVRKRRVR